MLSRNPSLIEEPLPLYLQYVSFVNEWTLPRIIYLLARGNRIGFLGVNAQFPLFSDFLKRWAGRQIANGRMIDIFTDRPDLVPMERYAHYLRSSEHFLHIEPWIEDHFNFGAAEYKFGRYGRAFKHLVCNYVNLLPFVAHTLETILSRQSEKTPTIIGASNDLVRVYRYLTRDQKTNLPLHRFDLRRAVNLILAIGLLTYVPFWILRRTRLRSPKTEVIFMGFDFSADIQREKILWEELSDAPQDNIIFYRSKSQQQSFADQLTEWRTESIESGQFGLFQALTAYSTFVRDIFQLTWRGIGLTPQIYWNLIKLSYKRIVYRGLLNRYRFKNFWGKDDYNTEHIIRTQELRRIGCTHYGRLHGLPAYPVRMAQQVYLDFDVYYVFGKDFARFHEKTWPETMRTSAVGAYGMNREQLWKLEAPRDKNIIVFLSDSFQTEKIIQSILKIAAAFPDRKLYVKTRGNLGKWRDRLKIVLENAPNNIFILNCSAEDAVFLGQYVFSDPSSLVVEGLQFGHYSFAFVLDDRWRGLYFEEFPDICVHSASEAIDRIRSIENDTWKYPRKSFSGLTNLSGQSIWDRIRMDTGLEPKENGPLPHLEFSKN